MDTELGKMEQGDRTIQVKYQAGSSGAVYGLGLIGAWVYYLSRATTFQEGVVGFFKGLFWPAFLVYALLEFLNQE